MTAVLSGLRILEFAAIGPVPWCGMVLADLGASVVRVERPGSAAERDTLGAVRRGRTLVELDLKSAEGREAALQLVERADILLEGLRPGVMERLGLGPQECMARNPRLVYGRMTGWGQTGPLAQQAGHDINYIALSGALHAIGTADKPVPPLNLVGDFGGGGAFLAIGVLAAAWQARACGRGQVVDAAMVDGSAVLMAMIFSRMLMGQWTDRRASNALDGGVPWYDTYRTRDGRFVAVGALEPQFYDELVQRLGLAGQLPDRQEAAHWPEIRRRFEEAFGSRTREEWAAHFAASDACVTPVLSLAEAMAHPHMQARGVFMPWDAGRVPAAAPVFDGARPPPTPPSRRCSMAEVLQNWPSVPLPARGPTAS
ncbi:CaiB/BaiF CoA transferase family protein [Variovorax sp. RA8]|uniref:CaiB/BaiF CoA transferase family protein n=1 Tax=Variovorax sp. (strain JCM 16519 / RA8) TaxID=662548 RepID=UPI001318A2E6|nr:CaiB/BaiF CoA-transferase family protein [Variovorax sp. RA8]VTU38848.1 Crotonobetainyl-CoA:carnitine CoA-transferase [Variovorax sp. RA8]